jgi:hypothetical protein
MDVIWDAYQRGLKELLAYLRGLAEEGKPLYEAKLVFMGEGRVDKTTLLAALTGQTIRERPPDYAWC